MKLTILTMTLLVLPLLSRAENSDQVDPQELKSLRTNWQAAKARAVDPINKKYIAALQALKLKYTKDGDLKAALAVEQELKNLTSIVEPPAFPDIILSKWWTWNGTDTQPFDKIIFNSDKTGKHTHITLFNWRVTGERQITISVPNKNGEAVLTWDEKYGSFQGKDFGSGKVSGRLVNPNER